LKIKPIKFKNKLVGENQKCYIIAEIGSNFDGSLVKAKKLIKLAKNSGADAVKFQVFTAEGLIIRQGFEQKTAFQAKWKNSVWDTYRKAEFPRKWHKELNEFSKKMGIHFFTSPWDFEAVDMLDELNPPAIKIGSGDITYLEILKYIGSKKRPVILATGASTVKEVENAVNAIKSTGNQQIILLHSVTQYPSPIEDANLLVLEELRKKFQLNVGYSDHSPGSLVALASVTLGARIIEKHFTDNPNLTGPDHPHSMDPKSFSLMIKNIRILEKALGNGMKKIERSEKETKIIQRRGIWTIKPIKKGEKFSKENISAVRPVIGVSASKFGFILGKKAKRNFLAYKPIKVQDI
jgi:sialic acid synthase SpsE